MRAIFGWMESLMGLHLGTIWDDHGRIGRHRWAARATACHRWCPRDGCGAPRRSTREHAGGHHSRLDDIGYYGASERVATVADIDVANEQLLRMVVDATIARLGRIDYLINNAGVAGAEQMVVDMDVSVLRYTLTANLVSNYSLIEKVVPIMKRQGSGYILNVLSRTSVAKQQLARQPATACRCALQSSPAPSSRIWGTLRWPGNPDQRHRTGPSRRRSIARRRRQARTFRTSRATDPGELLSEQPVCRGCGVLACRHTDCDRARGTRRERRERAGRQRRHAGGASRLL